MNISPVSNFNVVNNYQNQGRVQQKLSMTSFTGYSGVTGKEFKNCLGYNGFVDVCTFFMPVRRIFSHYAEADKAKVLIGAGDGGYNAYSVLLQLYNNYGKSANNISKIVGISPDKEAVKYARKGSFYILGRAYNACEDAFERYFHFEGPSHEPIYPFRIPKDEFETIYPRIRARLRTSFKMLNLKNVIIL